jgi:hypothetical protein
VNLGLPAKGCDCQIHLGDHQEVATPSRWSGGLPKESTIAEDGPDEVVESPHAGKKVTKVEDIAPVVGSAPGGIAQNLVSLGDPPEPSFGCRVPGIGVGV